MATPAEERPVSGTTRFMRWSRGRAGGLVLASTMVAGVFAAATAVGYTAPEILLDDATAPVAKGDSGIVVANAETQRVEAEAFALAPGKADLEPVRLSSGEVVVVNHTDGTVEVLPDDMRPDGTVIDKSGATEPADSSQGPRRSTRLVLVRGKDHGYLVDTRQGTVEQVDPATAPVRIPDGATRDAVPDSSAGIWVRTGKGGVAHVVGSRVTPAHVSGIEHLTVADGRPVGVTNRGEVLVISLRSERAVATGVPHGPQVVVGSARGAGRWILMVDRKEGRLVAVDARTGSTRGPYELPSGTEHNIGEPVQVDDRVYVPDHKQGKLIGYDVATGAELPVVDVPGRSGRFELFVEDSRVWANDPRDRRTTVIDQDAQPRLVDKGEGPGIETDEGKPLEPEKPQPESEPDPAAEPDEQDPPDSGPPPVTESEPETEQPAAELVTVPDVGSGAMKDEACALIESARLTCEPVAAGDGGRTNAVINLQPAPGARVPEGTTVVVRHYGQTAVPSVKETLIGPACELVEAGGFTCHRRPAGTSAGSMDRLGVVLAQDPAAGEAVDTGTAVTLTYADAASVPDYRDRDSGQVCNEIVEQSRRQVACTSVNGETQQQTGKPPGTVLRSDPPVVSVGGSVTLTVVAGSPPAPDLTGKNVDQACRDVATTYTCVPEATALARNSRIIVEQVPPPGTPLDPGSPITVRYSPEEPEKVQLFRAVNGDPVWVLRVGNGDPGLGNEYYDVQNPILLGYAYVKGRVQPGATTTVRDFYCTAGPDDCGGFARNHYYSTAAAPPPDAGLNEFKSYDTGLFLNACTMPGQIAIYRWRYWADGKRRYYAGPTAPSANWDSVESLGCIWAP